MPTFRKTKGSYSVTFHGRKYDLVPTDLPGNNGWDLSVDGVQFEQCLKTIVASGRAVEFHGMVADYLKSLGAKATPKGFHSFELETPLGSLGISIGAHTIYTRFEEPERAFVQLGEGNLNAHSGKWNFHYGEKVDAADMVTRFKYNLDYVMAMQSFKSVYMVSGCHTDGNFDGPICKTTRKAFDAYMAATPDTKSPLSLSRKDGDDEMKEVRSDKLYTYVYLKAHADSGRALLA